MRALASTRVLKPDPHCAAIDAAQSYVDEGIALDERAFARVTSVMVAYGELLGINKQGGEDPDERVDATLSSCETFGESAIR